jgi:uncharacterized membrane protein YcaP (DUF421 family)
MWFRSWDRILTTIAAGAVIYVFVIVVLRTSGKRTLAKLNAFDFVVTIALGSTVASGVVSRTVPVLEATVAIATLVALQFAVAVAASRWSRVRRAVTSAPTAILIDGELQADALASCRIAPSEVAAAVRKHGHGSLGEVDRVVLETDGTLSVIADIGDGTAMDDVDDGGRPDA